MVIMLAGQFVNSISGSNGFFMNMTGHHVAFQYILLCAVTANIVLNYWLIPILGIEGSAIASSVSTIFWNVITLAFIKYKYGKSTCYIPLVAAR